MNSELTLDDWQKVAQIAFYLVVGIITVLTFMRARKGLLSNVNTEYHKKVIERLDELSKMLLDEYDFDSPNHWSKKGFADEAVEAINKEFLKNKEKILAESKFQGGIISNPDYERLSRQLQRVKSDPFIPKSIRNQVTDLLENRANTIIEVHLVQLEKYKQQLAKGTYKGELKFSKGVIHNRILDELNKRGCGITQIEEEVHKIRLAIQEYFEAFHP
jgi:hypothetical protein